jgi:Mg2+ and Co2+ transporter CorA
LCFVASIFMALGLTTGMLGVNLGAAAVPPYAWHYVVMCAAAVLLLTAQAWALRRRRWL